MPQEELAVRVLLWAELEGRVQDWPSQVQAGALLEEGHVEEDHAVVWAEVLEGVDLFQRVKHPCQAEPIRVEAILVVDPPEVAMRAVQWVGALHQEQTNYIPHQQRSNQTINIWHSITGCFILEHIPLIGGTPLGVGIPAIGGTPA